MNYDTDALREIDLLGDVLVAVALARQPLPLLAIDEVLRVPVEPGSDGRRHQPALGG